MSTFEEIQEAIPNPIIQKIPVNFHGLRWYAKVWRYIHDPTEWVYVDDWKIRLPNGMTIMVPKGEITDFASIPWFIKPFATATGPLLRGAGVHDFGYRHRHLLDWGGNPICTRKTRSFFDGLFKDVVIWTTELIVLANSAYYGVKLFGWIAWNNNGKTLK